MRQEAEVKRIESELEVQTYLDRLKYVLQSNSVRINFQKNRFVDRNRSKKFTNRYTMATLFPNEDEVEVLKRELANLTVEDYLESVKDIRFPKKSELRVFGKKYSGEDVYIKIRVELLDTVAASGSRFVFVMSFHFAENKFNVGDFPYMKDRGETNGRN